MAVQTGVRDPISASQIGAANGVASLDSGGKVPTAQIPASIATGLKFKGVWNATTNSPTLASGVGTQGDMYRVSVAGSTNLDGITDWKVKDYAAFDGTAWQKIDGSDEVASVFGRTGAVTAQSGDYTAVQVGADPTGSAAAAQAASQPLDSDLTAIAAIAPSNDDVIQRKAGAWTNRTMAQILTDLLAAGLQTALNLKRDILNASPTSDLTAGAGAETATVTVDTNAVGIGAALFLNTDGNYDEADADQTTTMLCTALALATGTGSKSVLTKGYFRNDAWSWTVGNVAAILYVSTTQGVLTQTPPSGSGDVVQVVGFAVTSKIIWFDPQLSWVVIP